MRDTDGERTITMQRFCAVLLALSLSAGSLALADDFERALHEADVLAWRDSRRESLLAPTGFLTLAGLFWLDKERTTFGSATDNDLVFPAPADPHIGAFRLTADGVLMEPRPGVAVYSEDARVGEILIADDTSDDPVMITHGSLAWSVIKRDGRYAVRVRDFEHPALASFPALPYFPIDPSWRIEATLERYERPLILHARRVTGETERARDAVQETFLRLVRARREEVEPHLAEWLFTVCRNVALDMRRRESVMERTDGDHTDERPAGEPGPVAVLEQDERRGRVLALLERLPPKQQEVLRLRFQAGLTYKEIQRVTGHSLGNVGYLIHVGIRTLRARLAGDALEEVAS